NTISFLFWLGSTFRSWCRCRSRRVGRCIVRLLLRHPCIKFCLCFYYYSTPHRVVAFTAHLVTRYFVNEILITGDLFHLGSGNCWGKPHCSSDTRYSIHFHTEVCKAYIVYYIPRSYNQAYR